MSAGTATKELRLRYNSEIGNTGAVAQDVVRYLKAIEANTSATNAALLKMGGAAQQSTEGLRSMGSEGSRSVANLAKELGGLVASLGLVAGAVAGVKAGFDFNSEIQQMQLGLSAIVAANETVRNSQGQQVEGAQKLAYAQGQVADVFAKLKQDAINTTATMPQLVGAFQQVLGPAMGVGMSLDDARKVTVQLVQTMGALGIPMEQARSEINAIITGQMTQDTNLKNILRLSNEDVKLWTQKGTLAAELLKRTQEFGEAGKQAGEIWNGAISNLGDNLQQKVLGPLTGEAFKTATSAVKKLNAEAFNDETLNRAVRWGVILNDGVTAALIGSEAVGRILMIGADGFLSQLEKGKRWAAEVGVNQAKKEMRGQALDRLGLNPLQRMELGWNTDAKDSSSLMLQRAADLGVSPEKRAQLAKELARIDRATSGELERLDRSQSQGVKDQMAAERAKAQAAMAGKTHQFNTGSGAAGGGATDKLTGYELAVERFDHGRMGTAEFIKAARAEQAKFNEDAKEYWAIQDKIDAAQKRQIENAKRLREEEDRRAEAAFEAAIAVTTELQRFSMSGGVGGLKAAPATRGGLGVSGGTLLGGFSLGGGTKLEDPVFTGLEGAGAGTLNPEDPKYTREGDLLLRQIKAYQEWSKEEAKKWQQVIDSAVSSGVGLITSSISSGRGPSGGDLVRTGGDLAASAASFIPGYGWVAAAGIKGATAIGGSLLDRADSDRDAAKARTDLESAANERRSRWLHTSMMGLGSGPEAARDRDLIGLADEAENLKKNLGLTAEQIKPYIQAKEHEIRASYEAAKALEGVQKASSNFDAHLSTADIREKLGLGKKTSADVIGALRSGGIQGNLGVLGDTDFQKTVLTYYDMLAKNSTKTADYDPNAADPNDFYRKYFQNRFGVDLGQSNMSNNAVLELFKTTLIPALLDLKDQGLAGTKNIGMLNSDNPGELKFDAPQMGVTTIQQSNTWNIDGNVIGNPSAFEDLARRMGITIAVQGEQIA